MNNNNIVKIGTALKWRDTYDIKKKYYFDNVITLHGCVFRCKVLSSQGQPPVELDDKGRIVNFNLGVWDVIVDMSEYYNYVIDHRNATFETLEYIKKLDQDMADFSEDFEEYKESADTRILIVHNGANLTISIPNPIREYTKNKPTTFNVSVTSSIKNHDITIDSLTLYKGNTIVKTVDTDTLSADVEIGALGATVFKAVANYRGLEFTTTQKVNLVNPIYSGFGVVPMAVWNPDGKHAPKLSATGTYKATCKGDGQRFYILVPTDLPALSNFTMGGAPYVMNQSLLEINGVKFNKYESGATYNTGAEVNIIAK